MYICFDCGLLFEEPAQCHGEYLEHFGDPCQESWYGCPNCGGPYNKTYMCIKCNEYITDKYIATEDDNRICGKCYEERNICDDD